MNRREKDLQTLFSLMDKHTGKYNPEIIEKAYDLCYNAHIEQKRVSGEPFYLHPFNVACIIIKFGMDGESIVASLLHDVVEDTDYTLEDIKKMFGESVAKLVDGVTKLGQIPYATRENQQAENVRKMFIAMAQDIRVIIIKLADRLHNLRTIDSLAEQKQRDKAHETLEVYAPIAHRLGIRAFKEELEDISIKHLDPIAYHQIEDELNKKLKFRQEFLDSVQEKIKTRVEEYVSNVHIESRIKSINGIYRKMYMQGKAFEEIFDICAVRIITDTVNDCYNILGVIHDMFRPLPNRFKDYISTPKPNMYQSLHTTVIGRDGIPFEVQIRTWDMHHTAEYGIAAHWKYKEGVNKSDARLEERLSWIRQILEGQKDEGNAEDIIQTIKTDLAPEDVFAVTPKGDVINLPMGSTVIDFAFAIHTAVGVKMIGAKVEGKIVPITHKIKMGEVIEILTTGQANHGPSRDWLNIAKTTQAKNKIRAWFKKERRTENIETGKSEIEREFFRNRINLPDEEMEKFILEIAGRQRFDNIDDFYAAIGYGGVVVSKIMPRIKEDYAKFVKANHPIDIGKIIQSHKQTKSTEGVIVENLENCLVKLSRCCAPIPGDQIIGFITRGHGVSIHKRDCVNVPNEIETSSEPERWVKAYWADNLIIDRFKSSITIYAINRDQLITEVTTVLTNLKVGLHALNARELKDGNCIINITISVESVEHLKNVITKLQKIRSVYSVERTNQ